MNELSATHETLVFERSYTASTAKVFAAFEDVGARLEWSPPDESTSVVFDEANFWVGGLDVSRCGPKDGLQFLVETRYLDIIRDRRIVFSELVGHKGKRLSAALVTIDMVGSDSGTNLTLTVQLASFDGAAMGNGNWTDYEASLNNLGAYLSRGVRTAAG
jgi:uncharacterized protein YndB with AHSA1/START domain